MKVILWRRPDGGFSFTAPAGNTEDEAMAYAKKLQTDPHHAGYVLEGVCDEGEMPDGGRFKKTSLAAASFKGAWDCAGGKPMLVMDKAREIHKNRLRELRAPKLEALDVKFMKAIESGDSTAQAAIATQKQALRDVTIDQRIIAASTPEELKAVLPAILA